MAPSRRHIGASRRQRRDDEGEDESFQIGELEDDSLSEGSIGSHHDDDDDAEGDVSDVDEEVSEKVVADDVENGKASDGDANQARKQASAPARKPGLKMTVSDTEAMLNGLKMSDDGDAVHFDEMAEQRDPQTGRTPSAPPPDSKREPLTAKKRREHEKYTKEREQNPAFVPTRGSFFLHDKRTSESGSNNHRPFNKGKSKPVGLIVDGNSRKNSTAKADASEGQWTHDLHETVADDNLPRKQGTAATGHNPPLHHVPTAPRSEPPNRTFSSTTLIGNVPVVVFLPGMSQSKQFPAIPKKQHTRLPEHRPPLRRDKPVRISLPGQSPRYIYPSIERSFIFIPRAFRPNQQNYRGRGRGGGFYTGRRSSYYTAYTPSVLSVSRRSSLGMSVSQDGYPSPAGSVYSRPAMVAPDANKPVVRLPPSSRPPHVVPPAALGVGHPAGPMPPVPFAHPAYRESRPAPIPMHQPRPQKTVSVADIESPASFPFNPPQPQQEQPFHHQVPLTISGSGPEHLQQGPPSQLSKTPLSQIPERAIHAQPFQPYGYQAPGFYPGYHPGPIYYPGSGMEYPPYNGPMGPGISVPNYPSGPQPMPYMVPPPPADQSSQPGTVAHESNGTVYFYDANQMYTDASYGAQGQSQAAGGVVGMGGMMTPPGTTFYYPHPPGANSGAYYGPQ
ncbi:Uncharacterized protein PECH_000976 [Penicillium ucsense]|uniref:Btz domain-containing protein n=1 Tax=Penicillium ucsense TaxID=2839758 RepID=A0A8J8W1M8_9EURO|nr:Uncharacterized protein PECM_006671 [Penicillium ucsense]KAF7733196.1 Uncharacterized protein PECH_000976 [Penicillium ucsense]